MVKEEKTNILNIIALILHGVLKQCFYSLSKIGRNPKDGIKFNNRYQRHQQYHRQLKHPYWAIAFHICNPLAEDLPLLPTPED